MQYEVRKKILKGSKVYFYTNETLDIFYVEPLVCATDNIATADSDLLPGDMVEIAGDKCVKVQSTTTTIHAYGQSINIKINPITGAWTIVEDTTPSSRLAPLAQEIQTREICRCPFVNLGIVHKSSCSFYKLGEWS